MDGLEIIVTASAGMNVFILSSVLWSLYRIGRLEGAAKNGDFFSCPFFRKKVNGAAGCETENKRQQKDGKNAQRNIA